VTRRFPRPAKVSTLTDAPVFGAQVLIAPVLAAAALVGAVALSGCQATSPIQTNVPYQPADGVAVDLGSLHIRNLLVVASAKGEVGTMSGMVVNNGTRPVTVTFTASGAGNSATTNVPAGRATQLSGGEGTTAVTLPNLPAAPGDTINVTVSTPTDGTTQASAPVLAPQGYYATLAPTAKTSPTPDSTSRTPAKTSPTPATTSGP
jgi:hypothetical protein